jgi:hypothetical protein
MRMKNRRCLGLMVVGCGAIFFGCDEPLNPKGEHFPQLVVYSILTPKSDTQYVRLSSTYDVDGFNPFEKRTEEFVSGALVQITQGNQTYTFAETSINRTDSTRYSTPIHAYQSFPFLALPGSQVTLTIQSARFGISTATTVIPNRGTIDPSNSASLRRPSIVQSNITILLRIAPQTRGYIVRYFLVYESLEAGAWVEHEREVPVSIITYAGVPGYTPVFPKLERRKTEASVQSVQTETISYTHSAYRTTIADIRSTYGPANVRFKHVLFVMTQVDPGLYNYFNIVNGFQDEFSIRTDLPDYTNIRNGVGVFGSFTVDSTIVDLDSSF